MKTNPKVLAPLGVLGACALLVTLFLALRPTPETSEFEPIAPMVQAQTVRIAPLQFNVRGHGTVAPRTESQVVPQVSGPVTWISPALASGGFFEAGDVLVRIDRADYEVALETARAALARADAEYARATKAFERQQRLADSSVSSDSAYDDAVQRESVAEATVREARARLEQAARDLERTEIKAPYAGRVRTKEVGVGEFVTRGSIIGSIYAVDFAEVRLPIPDAELRFLDLPMTYRGDRADEAGPRVIVHANFAGGRYQWEGEIVRTEGEIDAKSRMVHVVARFPDPYGRMNEIGSDDSDRPPLAVGLFVEADIEGRRVPDAAVIPRSALRDGNQVALVGADGRVELRHVEILRIDRDDVVVGSGVKDGEILMTSGFRGLVDGMTVQIAPQPAIQAASGRKTP